MANVSLKRTGWHENGYTFCTKHLFDYPIISVCYWMIDITCTFCKRIIRDVVLKRDYNDRWCDIYFELLSLKCSFM